MDNSTFGIPKQLLATLRILNLDPDNLKWTFSENKQEVLLKLLWQNQPQQHMTTQGLDLLLQATWIPVPVMEPWGALSKVRAYTILIPMDENVTLFSDFSLQILDPFL